MRKRKLFSKYQHGLISAPVIKSEKLSHVARVVYGLLKSQIGGMEYITTTQKDVQKYLGVSGSSIKRAFKDLKKAGLLTKSTKVVKSWELDKLKFGGKGNQLGWIESAIMESDKLDYMEKLVYLYYAVTCGNEVSKCSRKTVVGDLSIGNDTYINKIDSLADKGFMHVYNGYSFRGEHDYEYITKQVQVIRLNFIPKNMLLKVIPIVHLKFKTLHPVSHDDRLIDVPRKVSPRNKKMSAQNFSGSPQNKKWSSQYTNLNKLNKLNNNKYPEKDSIIILEEKRKQFESLWLNNTNESADKEMSFKAYQQVRPCEMITFSNNVESNTNGFYGYHLQNLISSRGTDAEIVAEDAQFKLDQEANIKRMLEVRARIAKRPAHQRL
ncbi:MAG: hypothetical protein JKX79_07355 [Labilibaculum sp.]|nr:hypothetical protein [Labilibaculum sp.]